MKLFYSSISFQKFIRNTITIKIKSDKALTQILFPVLGPLATSKNLMKAVAVMIRVLHKSCHEEEEGYIVQLHMASLACVPSAIKSKLKEKEMEKQFNYSSWQGASCWDCCKKVFRLPLFFQRSQQSFANGLKALKLTLPKAANNCFFSIGQFKLLATSLLIAFKSRVSHVGKENTLGVIAKIYRVA